MHAVNCIIESKIISEKCVDFSILVQSFGSNRVVITVKLKAIKTNFCFGYRPDLLLRVDGFKSVKLDASILRGANEMT